MFFLHFSGGGFFFLILFVFILEICDFIGLRGIPVNTLFKRKNCVWGLHV